jgi:acetyltransferase-like isoleucine patch superfamily enzyme
MNAALEKYNGDSNVYSISGFSHSNDIEVPSTTYFLNLTSSWGWATWADKWRTFSRSNVMLCRIINDSGLRHRFDFDDSSDYAAMAQRQMDGHSDSWAIYWYASVFLRGGLPLYPARSLVKNTGFDGSGRHCGAGGEELQLKPFSYSLADNIEENHSIRALLVENKRKSRPGFLKKLLGNLKNKAKDWLPAGARFIVMRIAARIKLFFIKKNVGKNTFIDRTVNVYGWEHVRIGDNTLIGEFSWLNVNNRKKGVFHISIGNYCYFGRRNLFTSGREMIFGDYVMTSNDCRFLGNNHVFADPMHPYVATGTTDSGVQKIGHNVWLGAGVTVLGSLEIGHGSVIGAGSVVTGTIPPFSVAVGNPCRVIKRFDFRNRCWLDIDEFVRHPELESLMPSAAEYLQLLQKNHPQIDMPKFAATSRFGDLP